MPVSRLMKSVARLFGDGLSGNIQGFFFFLHSKLSTNSYISLSYKFQ